MMERRMKRKFHVRCEAGENLEITSKSYLSLSDLADLGTVMENVYHTKEEMIDKPYRLPYGQQDEGTLL